MHTAAAAAAAVAATAITRSIVLNGVRPLIGTDISPYVLQIAPRHRISLEAELEHASPEAQLAAVHIAPTQEPRMLQELTSHQMMNHQPSGRVRFDETAAEAPMCSSFVSRCHVLVWEPYTSWRQLRTAPLILVHWSFPQLLRAKTVQVIQELALEVLDPLRWVSIRPALLCTCFGTQPGH